MYDLIYDNGKIIVPIAVSNTITFRNYRYREINHWSTTTEIALPHLILCRHGQLLI